MNLPRSKKFARCTVFFLPEEISRRLESAQSDSGGATRRELYAHQLEESGVDAEGRPWHLFRDVLVLYVDYSNGQMPRPPEELDLSDNPVVMNQFYEEGIMN